MVCTSYIRFKFVSGFLSYDSNNDWQLTQLTVSNYKKAKNTLSKQN